MIDHTALKKALKTLDTAPKEAEKVKEKYKQTLENIKSEEKSGFYSPNYIKQKRIAAKEEHDRIIKGLTDSMKSALAVVKANNDYENEELNLDDPKLTNAFNIINATGKNLSHQMQVKVLNQFRGNPAALHVLEDAYRKNGLYFASLAREMGKPISDSAIHDMEMVFAYADYDAGKGITDLPMEHARWTKNQFAEQATRLGYDLSNESGPFEYTLQEMQRSLEFDRMSADAETRALANAKSYAIDKAMADIKAAKSSGADESAIFDSAIRRVERLS